MKYEFPAEQYQQHIRLVPIDVALIPFISGALNQFFVQTTWKTREDYELGYNAFAQLLIDMQKNHLQELTDAVNRVYRLLDTSINGTVYSVTPATQPQPAPAPDPTRPTITPALPLAPSSTSPAELPEYAWRHRFERLVNLMDSLTTGQQFPIAPAFLSDGALQNDRGLRETITQLQGLIDAGWFGIGGQRATLADVVRALRVGSENNKDQVLGVLDLISGAGSSATVFNTVRDFFSDSVDLGLEGAQFAVLLAATMSQITSNVFLDQKLDRIIRALDGGGLVPPDDNLVELAAETRDLLSPEEAS